MDKSTFALSLKGVCKRIDDSMVLDHLDLELPPGELVAILGSSGAGKTTLLRLIAGLEDLDGGVIRLDDEVVASPKRGIAPEKRRLGYLAQDGALFPHLSVTENIAFGVKTGAHDRGRAVDRMLDLVNLPLAYRKRFPHELSGGEQQRVALARALASNPRLVLLDEPFSSLDANLRTEVREAVLAALKRVGASAVLVTHDPTEAMCMGDRVAVLMRGRIAQCTDPISLYRYPVDLEVGRFVGQAIILDGVQRDNRIVCPLGSLIPNWTMENLDNVRILVRPEQIGLVPYGNPGSIAAQTISMRYFGQDALIGLRLQDPTQISITARVCSHAIPRVGERVGVSVSGSVCAYPRVFPAVSFSSDMHVEKRRMDASRRETIFQRDK